MMMSKKIVLCASMAALCWAVPVGTGRASTDMREGEWETTMEMKMEGMPFAIPPVKSRQCITKDDLVPRQKEGSENCKTKSQKVTGNKVTWSTVCKDKGSTVESEGDITYHGDSYKGSMRMKSTDDSGQTMHSTATLNGRRIGECTGKSRRSVTVGGREVTRKNPAK